jgi:hypothetical protein
MAPPTRPFHHKAAKFFKEGSERTGVSRLSARARRIATFAVLAVACLVAGIRPQVLEIGRAGPHVWVREGDLVSLHYIQSMYGVPVEERLRVEAAPPGAVRFCFELTPGGVRATIGPLREDVISAALQGLPPAPGELSLRRILEAVVDSYGIAGSEDGDLTVRLIKARRR